jgi:hypothetical protein
MTHLLKKKRAHTNQGKKPPIIPYIIGVGNQNFTKQSVIS